MFLISLFTPSPACDSGRTETLQSHRSCPFSMSASLTAPYMRICLSEVRNAKASSGGDLRLRNNFHQRRAGTVEIDAGAIFEMKTFGHVLLEVNPNQMH